jgi:peptidoglycan/xylan/chitin deacetylase (PgdA/CDA1 family)
MKVPNADRAMIDIAKLRYYSLCPTHREGKHKARVFAAALEITEDDADWFRSVLLEAVRQYDCELGKKTFFGQRYMVDFLVVRAGKQAQVRSVWNVRPNENVPRLVTCYVL